MVTSACYSFAFLTTMSTIVLTLTDRLPLFRFQIYLRLFRGQSQRQIRRLVNQMSAEGKPMKSASKNLVINQLFNWSLVILLILAAAIAFLGGHPAEDLYWTGMYIAIAGVVVLIAAKLPKILKGDLFSFGASNLKGLAKFAYYAAYVVILVGVVMQVTAYVRLSH